jgi:hypothetical protein
MRHAIAGEAARLAFVLDRISLNIAHYRQMHDSAMESLAAAQGRRLMDHPLAPELERNMEWRFAARRFRKAARGAPSVPLDQLHLVDDFLSVRIANADLAMQSERKEVAN